MRVAGRRQFKLVNKKRKMPRWLFMGLIVLAALVGIFVLANLTMLALYRNKVLPNYTVAGVSIGGMRFDRLDDEVSVDKLLPKEVTFKKDDTSKKVTPKDLGVTVDWTATQQHIKESRSWLPVLSLFIKHSVPAELTLDNSQFAKASTQLEETFTEAPLPERIAFSGDNFAIVAPEAGYQLEVVQLRQDLIGLLELGKTELPVPTKATNSSEPTGKLGQELSALQKKLDAKISFVASGQTKQLSRTDIAGFFETSGQTLKLSEVKMKEVVAGAAQGLGVTAINQDDAVQASQHALAKDQPVTFRLARQGVKVYHYCVAAKDVPTSALPEYRQKLAAVYGDPRGWNNGGEAVLMYAESGCDFTAWLSSAAGMTTFSASVCDNYYSCRVGTNVIVNVDRWKGATDPWNAAGGTLEDYRVMVINHETGHWFGFGHRNCTAPGQPAPVMQQQSIDLQGCTFNPWPTATELAVL